jgi:hypothetical protein
VKRGGDKVDWRANLGPVTLVTTWLLPYAVGAVLQVSPAPSKLEQDREACLADKTALGRMMAEVFRDFQAAQDPAALEVLVGIDGRIRALLRDRPSYRPCGTDRELLYDKRWEVMGVKTGYWDDLTYTGQLLVSAHRRFPRSPYRAYTLFSTVFGETSERGLGIMPDIRAAYAYGAEFPDGPFIKDVYLTIADFHKDLYMVLRDRLTDVGADGRHYKYDCFAPYIGTGPWRSQEDRAKETALEYYQRVLRLTPGDERVRTFLEETRKGVVRAWSFCAD